MTDEGIIKLLQKRQETALEVLQQKYGGLCASVARRILPDARDVEECVNDTWTHIWNAIPPEQPVSLRAYAARIVRNLCLDRMQYNTAEKRNSALTEAFEELEYCIPTTDNHRSQEDRQAFSQMLNDFLRRQSRENRAIFLRRYWYGESIAEIAKAFGATEGKIKSSLFRTRNALRETMEKEGIAV